ncbi:DUF1822 family protein [Oculatella sp. LEGE 06141]|uniref:DUF1822 family protein n=1 Tax=Oculatella sp. LEGE 06141 TaxID=1828648 RepID=UPI0018810075|nr:DUF1822 family protein [Oculatella sp. LEGE 06141]MBE9177973.1 DUF1822 family protein [Oculatella sp. LEGE 06141]
MTFNSALFDPIQVCLDIEPALQTQAWQQSQSFATPSSQWNAYLNQLCLDTVLPWLQDAYERQATPAPSATALPGFWELVNGSAIAVNRTRLVLIPTEAIDVDEIRVPQEWVDIPDWIADYYLAVQVNPDDRWVRINGFTTHWQLKQRPVDWSDRTYPINESDLTADLNALWVARQLHPEATTRARVPAVSPLPLAQAQTLLQRLGDPSVLVPRLAIPVEQWRSLIAHGGWRQRLSDQRRGLPEQQSPLQWLQAGISNLSQQSGWTRLEFQPGLAVARGEATETTPVLAKELTIANHSYELRISAVDRTSNIWRFELQQSGGTIPAGIILRLLTEDLQPFAGNEDTANAPVEQLYIEVSLAPGEGLVWEIEPTPDHYDQEILRF